MASVATISNNDFFCPTVFTQVTEKDVRLSNLQQKMMDNGWQLFIDEASGKSFFKHKTYGEKHVQSHRVNTSNGMYTFPIINQDEDPKGLGCSFNVSYGSGLCEIVSNEWESYWDNRNGRRREKYLIYLKERQAKKAAIEEEQRKHREKVARGQ